MRLSCQCAERVGYKIAKTTPCKVGAPPSASLRQPSHHLVELFEVSVADLDGAAGIAVADAHGKTERVAHALFQRDRIGILRLAPAAAAGLLRLALRHALLVRQRLGLADV